MNLSKKKCYVCHSNVENTTHSVLNPKVNAKHWTLPEKPICGNASYRPRSCYSILRQLAAYGKCDKSCCAVSHLASFDLDKHIEELKKGKFIEKYRHWASNLLHQVGRINKVKNYEP